MYTFPNQKTITIHRKELKQPFLGINKDTFVEAYKNLNATALALYLFFLSNKDNYTFALSPAGIAKELGMPESTCKDQIEKLIKKNYLIQRKEGSNQYDLYETPQSDSTDKEAKAKKNSQDEFQLI